MDALIGHTKSYIAFNNNGSLGIGSDGTFYTSFTNAGDIWTKKYGWLHNYYVRREEISYQKVGGFEIRKYPDGTMIQTFIYEQNDIYPERGEQTFAWAVAFVGNPLVVGQITSSYNGEHDVGINILSKSTNARAYYRFYEHGRVNQGLCRIQFVGIGRWK